MKLFDYKPVSSKTPLRYPGGKTRMISQLMECFPMPLPKTIVSPFIGGGSFEVYLAAKGVKVKGSDIFQPLANFWQELLNEPERLYIEVKRFENINLDEAKAMQRNYMTSFDVPQAKAAEFYVLNRTSFSGKTLTGGLSPQYKLRFTSNSIENIRKFHAPNLSVECCDFEKIMLDNPDDWLYLDPPYHNRQGLYGRSGNTHTNFDHDRLLNILKDRDKWVLSYNDCEEVREMYDGFHIREVEVQYSISPEATKKKTELIISV